MTVFKLTKELFISYITFFVIMDLRLLIMLGFLGETVLLYIDQFYSIQLRALNPLYTD